MSAVWSGAFGDYARLFGGLGLAAALYRLASRHGADI